MKEIRKHLALVISAAILLFIIFIATQLYFAKNDSLFKLVDLEGSRAALEDVELSGELMDGFHQTEFSIDGGTVSTDTKILGQPHYRTPERYPRMYTVMEGGEYEVWNYRYYADITYRDLNDNSSTASTKVNYSELYPTVGEASYTNPFEYGLAIIDDQVYFTVPTAKPFTGTNAIHALTFFEGGISPKEETHHIASFSLAQNKQEDAPSLDVLGLEAVGNQLALILVEGDQLVVQAFNTDGQKVGEARAPNFVLHTGGAAYPDADKYYEAYEAFRDAAGQTLTLSFRSTRSTQSESVYSYISFEQGGLVYKGELETDVNDDLIRVINQRDGYGYSNWEHRYYDHVQLMRRGEAK